MSVQVSPHLNNYALDVGFVNWTNMNFSLSDNHCDYWFPTNCKKNLDFRAHDEDKLNEILHCCVVVEVALVAKTNRNQSQ